MDSLGVSADCVFVVLVFQDVVDFLQVAAALVVTPQRDTDSLSWAIGKYCHCSCRIVPISVQVYGEVDGLKSLVWFTDFPALVLKGL